MVGTFKRYDIRQVNLMREQLDEWINTSSDVLNNEEAKDYPNEERIDSLNTRIDALQAAYDALGEIE